MVRPSRLEVEGVLANRHRTWGGLRWTLWRRARVVVRTNGAWADVKACGP